jgi:hypothetical protein
MKKYLNTLFVTTQGAYLAKEGETVVVKVQKEIRLRIPTDPKLIKAIAIRIASECPAGN